jgi:hypothetical protein
MAYTTPPTFADNNVLSASQLNILSDDVEYLYGVVRQTNPETQMVEVAAGDSATGDETKWAIRHKTETFKYRMDLVQGTADAVRIKYGSTTVFTDAADRSATYSYDGTVDLTSFAFTVGDWYLITVELDGEPASAVNRLYVYDLREIV